MRKVKIKKVKMALGGENEELADMFNQMLGTGTANIPIAYPRYKRIRVLCEQLVKLFGLLKDSPFMVACTEFSVQAEQLNTFCTWAKGKIIEIFNVDLSDFEWDFSRLTEAHKKLFSEAYEAMKRSDLVKTFVLLCDKLVPYKKYFIDLDNLNHKFITTMAGTDWSPFPFTTLNIKHIFTLPGVGENTITFFMTILNKAYVLSRQLYDELQSPDIDIDKLADLIMSNINEIQRRPELSRCGEAIRKIKESIGLLKNRLPSYYRDFLATNDNTIIMQHFIIDVSSETKASPTVIRQFGIIADYYRNIAEQQITNPKVKMLLSKINESFKELERGTTNLVNIREDTEGQSTTSGASDTTGEAATHDTLTSPTALSIDDLRSLIDALPDVVVDDVADADDIVMPEDDSKHD